jgi:N6-L-threonylcarbamoyladenine synthase
MDTIILGIESSCDDTSAAIIRNGFVLSNNIANQDIHKAYGGVVPELASRAHQQNIIPVVEAAIKQAGIKKEDISAVAFTRGPGLMGALLVGTSFAKGFALARQIPIIEVNHLHAHILSLFLREMDDNTVVPAFPFICLLVSGGHTQLMIIRDFLNSEIIGRTIDDAAGEAFDKCAKVMGLPYPGGPLIDKYAGAGRKDAFNFSKPQLPAFDYSFSGLKTSFLYFLRDRIKTDPDFIQANRDDICASVQATIIDILLDKLIPAVTKTGITNVAVAGGVSANSGLRKTLTDIGRERKWNVFLPEIKYSTDNAAMIAITGFYKYMEKCFASHDQAPFARIRNS